MNKKKHPPIHPGELLQEHFFEPRDLTLEKIAKDIHVPSHELKSLVAGKTNLTTDLACRLGLYFQLGAKGFLNLQQIYDLECWKDKEEEKVKKQVRPYQEAVKNFKHA